MISDSRKSGRDGAIHCNPLPCKKGLQCEKRTHFKRQYRLRTFITRIGRQLPLAFSTIQ